MRRGTCLWYYGAHESLEARDGTAPLPRTVYFVLLDVHFRWRRPIGVLVIYGSYGPWVTAIRNAVSLETCEAVLVGSVSAIHWFCVCVCVCVCIQVEASGNV